MNGVLQIYSPSMVSLYLTTPVLVLHIDSSCKTRRASHKRIVTYSITQIVRQFQVSGETVGKCVIKLEHSAQSFQTDRVQGTIGERADTGCRWDRYCVPPGRIAKHIAFTWRNTNVDG